VILPSLARDQAAAAGESFSRTLDWALRLILVIAMPAAVALLVIGDSILTTLFLYRKTTSLDIEMSAYALAAVAFGLTAFMLIKVLAPGYYSRQDMRTPVRIGIIAIVANMLLSVALVIPLHMYWRLGHVGLALATSLAAWINAGLLARGLLQVGVFRPQPGWGRFALQLAGATIAMGAVLILLDPATAQWLPWPWWRRVAVLLAICGAGFAVYVGTLWLTGVRPRHLRGPARA
jgi:putative peptidoglycan lipid II flippase